ncbi:MAG: lactonase family protein [Planctomycetota bacterium]|nr:lactonase family protein [Planctomycetota bacterium]
MQRQLRLLAAILLGTIMTSTNLPAREPDVKSDAEKWHVYIGTYTGTSAKSKGIYRFDLTTKTGKLGQAELVAEIKSPSFLEIHPNGKTLYAAGEIGDFEGGKGGAISALAIDRKTGKLKLLNQKSSVGGGPCHVSVDPTGQCVMAANYGGGSVISLPLNKDGSVGTGGTFVQHTGSSVNDGRQKEPHAHSINTDKTGKFALAADLGVDRVFIYKLNATEGTMVANDPPSVKSHAGAGPRHLTVHPSNKLAFVNNELDSSVTSYAFDAEKGTLTPLDTQSTLPVGSKVGNSTAEVQVHPNGRFVYVSNRGDDSLAIFSVDTATGKLTPIGHQKTGGQTPRNFTIHPSGEYLLAANQTSDTVVLFKVDPKTGLLTETDQIVQVPAPVCIRYLAAE